MKFDSVFSGGVSLAQFSQAKDEKVIIDGLNKLEIGSKNLIGNLPIKIVDALFKLDNPKSEQWKYLFLPQMQSLLWMTWLSGWDLGLNHANNELNKKVEFSRFANFDELVKVRSISNTPAEDAIRSRINQLASDVTNSEWSKIKDLLEQAISAQPGTSQPISRTELVKGIEQELGINNGRYRNRAQTIARTELTFAYNAGRLQTYRDSGLVEAVRFYTILDERRCPICASRQGLVILLKNWREIAANSPPLHPNCRCVLTAVLKKDKIQLKDKASKIENRELVPRPLLWSAAAILAAVLIGNTGGVSAANPTLNVVANSAVTLNEAVRLIREEVGEKDTKNATEPEKASGQKQKVTSIETAPLKLIIRGIDINSASREELQKILPGRLLTVRQVNEIIKARNKKPFESIGDLANIPGIGRKTFDRLKQLAEGSDIIPFLDPQSIRTPAQLWAANLGLTKSQAQTVFNELQRGAFKDIDDLKQRLKGKGVGDKAIENMQQRAIVRQSLPPAKNVVTQGIVKTSPSSSSPSRPSFPSPIITPPSRDTRNRLRIERATQEINEELKQLNAQARNYAERTQDATNKQLTSKNGIFDKSINSQLESIQSQVDELSRLSSNFDDVQNNLSAWNNRLASLEDNFDNLLDPARPNYFEQSPQIVSQLRSQLNVARQKLLEMKRGSQYADEIENRINRVEKKVENLSRQKSAFLSQQNAISLKNQLNSVNQKISSLERIVQQIPPGSERSDAWVQLQRLKRGQLNLNQTIKSTRESLEEIILPVINTARNVGDDFRLQVQSVNELEKTIEKLEARLSKLPTTKSQLDDATRAKYDTVRDLRSTQRRLNSRVQQYRQAESISNTNLNNRASRQDDFYNSYDEQFRSFETNTSPLIQRAYNQIQVDIKELEAMPEGWQRWLLGFNGWNTNNIPPDLALVLPGSPTSSAAITRIKEMAKDIQSKINRIENNIEIVKRQSEFRFINSSRTLQSFDDVLATTEDNLSYWNSTKNNLLNQENIGSSNNRLNKLWREIEKARKAGDEKALKGLYAQITPDDTYGYARRTLLELEDWGKRYGDILGENAPPGTLANQPINKLYGEFLEAQEAFLQQLGQSRINQSQLAENALQDAQDIYQRIRNDASKVPEFDVNGMAYNRNYLLSELNAVEDKIKSYRQITQYSNLTPVNQKAIQEAAKSIDYLNMTGNKISQEVDVLQKEIEARQQQGKGIKRLQNRVIKKQQELNNLNQQIKQFSEEIQELRLSAEDRKTFKEIKSQIESVKLNIKNTQTELAQVTQEISRSEEQLQQLGEMSQRGRSLVNRIEGLKRERNNLISQLGEYSQQVSVLNKNKINIIESQ